MNVKRKNGNALSKMGLIGNALFGKIGNVHSAFSKNSHEVRNMAPYLSDAYARKSMEAAHLNEERCRAEASRLRLYVS